MSICVKFDTKTICNTAGNGLWSNKEAAVELKNMEMDYISEECKFSSLSVYFNTKTWKVNRDGLIYTDKRWIREFREFLINKFGFSEKAVKSIGYSEQGMQGDDYVDLDCGHSFIKEFMQLAINGNLKDD